MMKGYFFPVLNQTLFDLFVSIRNDDIILPVQSNYFIFKLILAIIFICSDTPIQHVFINLI